MKKPIDYVTLDDKRYRARVAFLRRQKAKLTKMAADEVHGSVSARVTATRELLAVDAELITAEQSRLLPVDDKVSELDRENKRLRVALAEKEARIQELEAAAVANEAKP